ncbi:hypothetical protein ACWGOQ_0000955 [Aquimarina sp. M1]
MKNKLNFIILVSTSLIITAISNFVLGVDELFYNSMSEQLTLEQLDDIMEAKQKWKYLGYCFFALFLLIKVSSISLILYVGLFLFNIEIKYKKVFSIVAKAEFIFVIVMFIKLLWLFVFNNYDYQNVQYFYPFSALHIVGYEGLSPWFIYPFQTLNLFELAYWFVLSYLLGKQIKISTDKALKIVASSYGSALLIWVVTVMFFTLNAS